MSNEKLITMQFSLNLRKILENRGLTQKELADKMGISKLPRFSPKGINLLIHRQSNSGKPIVDLSERLYYN